MLINTCRIVLVSILIFGKVQAKEYTKQSRNYPISPLDRYEESPLGEDFVNEDYQDFELNPKPDIDECSASCSKHLNDAVRTAIDINSNIVAKYVEICRQYELARECRLKMSHCRYSESFDVLTSGIHYMCIDMRESFDALMPCVNEEIEDVRAECDNVCNTNALVHGMLVKKLLENDFKFLKMLDPHMMKITMSETCRVGECLLQCYKTKLNLRCEGNAGSLISETLVRPFDNLRSYGGFLPSLISFLLPPKCSFLTNSQKMSRFRISPELEASLKKMYADRTPKNVQKQLEHSQPLVDPWKKFEDPVDSDSPLLNQDVYYKNGSPQRDELYKNFQKNMSKSVEKMPEWQKIEANNQQNENQAVANSPLQNSGISHQEPQGHKFKTGVNEPDEDFRDNTDQRNSFEYENNPEDPYLFVRPLDKEGTKELRQIEPNEKQTREVLSTSVSRGQPYEISLNFVPRDDGELVCSIRRN
uniref:Chondroitin proteoglycan 4 domain-containing protein n=1 Tax=Acrobeloides nanus TaxID=290746 RepID=A0A914EL87_9BILA